ncbi:MAG: helix-turn-helix domain-containing protein [Chloroflexota bacterium]|nr:helix-turn-helix domain-containing protein [Chloroflexota bacterium]
METKMLSTADVAERLLVHQTTVQGWIRQGHFPNAYKLGPGKNSPYVIPESDVIAFEENRKREATK